MLDSTSSSRKDVEYSLGAEFSGIQNKRRIMGIVNKGGISSSLTTPFMSWEVPKSWTLKDSATVPQAYFTVYYAFFNRFTIRKGQTIFITVATGGIGVAAIRVALAYGLEVFTICHNDEAKKNLLKTIPELKESHVCNTADSYEEVINSGTKSKGVDVILNSCWQYDLQRLLGCIADGGTLLEVCESDMVLSNSLFSNVAIIPVNVNFLLENLDDTSLQRIKDMINIDILKDIVKPLPSVVFPSKDIRKGFDFMMNDKPVGKVLIRIRDESNNNEVLPVSVVPRIYFNPEKLYIVIGDMEVFDLEVVDFMVLRGARMLLLQSKRISTYLEYRMK